MENSCGCETINWERTGQDESEESKRKKAKRNTQNLLAFPIVYMLKEETGKYLKENKDRSKCEI